MIPRMRYKCHLCHIRSEKIRIKSIIPSRWLSGSEDFHSSNWLNQNGNSTMGKRSDENENVILEKMGK